MARRLNNALLVLIAFPALIQISYAQTRHVVGDALGWSIPPGGPSVYSNWASGKKFNVGDVLVFSFTTGSHDVAEVTKAAFDACNAAGPVSVTMNGPANIALNKPGEQYFICGFAGHCSAGQKLHVTVSAASSSPAPQPSSAPSPRAAASSPIPSQAPSMQPNAAKSLPTPALAQGPASGPITYTVGDNMGWNIPSANPAGYQSWARGKSFKVGDVLVFNFPNGTHNVAEVTKQAYDSCSTNRPTSLMANPPVRVTLKQPGEHYFLCTFPGHCAAGQKLAVNVGRTSFGAETPSAPSPSISATTPSSNATPTGATSPSGSNTPTAPTAVSPEGVASPPTQENFAPSLGVTGVSATFLTAAVAFFVLDRS